MINSKDSQTYKTFDITLISFGSLYVWLQAQERFKSMFFSCTTVVQARDSMMSRRKALIDGLVPEACLWLDPRGSTKGFFRLSVNREPFSLFHDCMCEFDWIVSL